MSIAAPRMAAADRRQHLVETAIRLFTEGSYHGTTTAEIARSAGVSEPILYRHFASKRDLYLAALTEYVAALGGRLEVRAVFDGEEILVRRQPPG